ncbi:hypothetical protein MAR_012152 [Mya arenaria]|uniref:Uncharacterized protein n=1 Tax=Mya arenaria TaxID=6604 RepID=A0ABY7FW53_MYAAR|nr:hypothetical protein MAR_012152 [Mya arenaria]
MHAGAIFQNYVQDQGALKKSLSPEQIKEDLDNLVTAASSELDKVGNTFLQLKLVINTGNGVTNSYMVKHD